MEQSDNKELLELAQEYFMENKYSQAEPILNQLILNNYKDANIFHMLGTIFYDQGKFNKAIRSFKRAIETDPSFTDASVGLSIILNDLGRYDEAKKVFDEAKTMLASISDEDPYINEKLAIKHDELGELYFQYKRVDEALEQYQKALSLSNRKAEVSMKIVECHIKNEDFSQAIDLLESLNREYPEFVAAKLKLGMLYYDSQKVPEAVEQWEQVLKNEPNNTAAKDYLKLAQAVEVTRHDQVSL